VVTGPAYQAIDVAATLVVADPSLGGAAETQARAAIEGFLHPLTGGPEGRGWRPAQPVAISDLAAVVEGVAAVDYAAEIGVVQRGVVQDEVIELGPDRLPVAGEISLRVIGA